MVQSVGVETRNVGRCAKARAGCLGIVWGRPCFVEFSSAQGLDTMVAEAATLGAEDGGQKKIRGG
jgi:hypothetical protein